MPSELPASVETDDGTYAVCDCDTLVQGNGEVLCGCVDFELRIIHIARRVDGKKMTAAQRDDTLVHEIAHIALRPDGPLVEDFVGKLATLLAQAITRNNLTRKERGA